MARTDINCGWSLELEDGFERRTEEGDVVLWKPGRTVYAAVFDADNAHADSAIARLLKEHPTGPKRTFDRLEPGLVGHAYLLPEGDGEGTYWGLNTWAASRGSVACVTFYFDELEHAEWALKAWETLCNQGKADEPPRYLN